MWQARWDGAHLPAGGLGRHEVADQLRANRSRDDVDKLVEVEHAVPVSVHGGNDVCRVRKGDPGTGRVGSVGEL